MLDSRDTTLFGSRDTTLLVGRDTTLLVGRDTTLLVGRDTTLLVGRDVTWFSPSALDRFDIDCMVGIVVRKSFDDEAVRLFVVVMTSHHQTAIVAFLTQHAVLLLFTSLTTEITALTTFARANTLCDLLKQT